MTNLLKISRILKAPPAKVWKAWTTPELMEEWWMPKPYSAKVRRLDATPGGVLDIEMRDPEGKPFPAEEPACFLVVEPERRLVWTSALTEGFRPSSIGMPGFPFTAIVEMAPHAEGTAYSATTLHRNAEDARKHSEMGFEQGWGMVADQLGEVAANL